MTDAIAAALDAMTRDLAEAARWLDEIESQRRGAIRRVEELRAGIRALAPLLDLAERDRRLAALEAAAPGAVRPGPPVGRTERMAAVLQVLATHPTGTIRTAELQRYLMSNALAKDSRAAARALAKKARQGIVERIDWGTYRIATDHPALVRAREAGVTTTSLRS